MVDPERVYNVPIISFDLRRDETVLQFADALEYLTSVSDQIFDKVNQRVQQNRKELEALTNRIKVAEAKIEKVRGSNKATQVFSSSKYPAPEELKRYSSVFKDVSTSLREVKRAYKKIKSKHVAFEERSIKEKMQFYSIPRPQKKSDYAEQGGEGLGGLPENIQSLSSLLLFNSSENPYKKYTTFDPLGATTKTRAALEAENAEENGIGDAPMSISNREQMERQVAENYFYIPDLGDVPEINVPMDLPDLPGVADLTFSSDVSESIAPSLLAMSNLPDLPGVGETAAEEGPPPPAPVQNEAAPPPPPPPPPPPANIPPPPAPPPPPPSAPPSTPSSGSVPSAVANPDGGRSSLLESIRQAGGIGKAKLKSGKDRKLQKKKQKEQSVAASSGGGDLMSDLFSKLSMRRKGISGSKGASAERPNVNNNNDLGGGSAMDKISAMIPAPTAKASKVADDDDDWN